MRDCTILYSLNETHVFPFRILVVARFYNVSLDLTYHMFVSQLDSFSQKYFPELHLGLRNAAVVENIPR